MHRSFPLTSSRLLVAGLLTALALTTFPSPGRSQEIQDQQRTSADDAAAQRASIVPSKKALLWAGPMRHLNTARAQAKIAKSQKKNAKPGVTVKKAFQDPDAAVNEPRTWTGLTNPMAATSTAAAPVNVRANNPTGDNPAAGQSESSIAVLGNFVVTAWNVGRGERDRPEFREGADLFERRSERGQAVARNPAVARLQADDSAERRRLADRAAGVRA